MKKPNMSYIGLLCGAFLFLAGALFSFNQTDIYVISGSFLLLMYWPLFCHVQRRLDPNYKFRDGLKEYLGVLVFTAILVFVVFLGTKDYLNAAMSEYMKNSSNF